MDKRVVYTLLYIAIGAIGGFAMNELLSSSEKVVEVVETPVVKVQPGDSSLKKRVKSLENELAERNKTISDLMAKNAGGAESETPKSQITPMDVKTISAKNGDLAKLLGDLVGKGMLSQNGRAAPTQRDKYAPLIDALGLNAEEADALLALIGGTNAFLPADLRSYDEGKLKELLGEDGYKAFQEYEHELPARMFADDLSTALAESGLALSDEQYQEFLNLNPSTVKGIPLSYSPMTITLNGNGGEGVSEMVDGAVGKAVDDFSETVSHAEKILNEEQMEVFDSYMGERLEQKETAAATAQALLPGILQPGLIKNLGGNGSVQSSVTIISDEMQVDEPVAVQ